MELWLDPAPADEPRSVAPDVTVLNRVRCVVPGGDTRFTSSDESVVRVDGGGTITAVGSGQAVVTTAARGREVPVEVTVDDGVRRASGLLVTSLRSDGHLLVGGSIRLRSAEEISPFDPEPNGPVTIRLDGVEVVAGHDPGPGGAVVGEWASVANLEAELGLDLSPGSVHTLTYEYEGETFYRPLTFSVRWTVEEGTRYWKNGEPASFP